MKKFYAFLAAALMSVSVFAASDVVPSDAILADYYNSGDVCVCIFVPADMACNDMVLTGSFNGWSSAIANCIPFEAVEGYDGWYVASFEAEAEPDATKGMQAKPIMLDADGNFNWNYQVGAATAIRGGVTVVQGSYAGEIDLINYGADAPNVFTVDAWKQNPCTAVYHNYTIVVVSDGCGGYVVPFIAGSMTSWTDNGWTQMQYNSAKTAEYDGVPTYTYSFKAAEGGEFQIVSGKMGETGEIEIEPAWADDAYMQEMTEAGWARINGGSNFVLGEVAEVVFDLRVDTLQWARCDETPAEYVIVALNLPVEHRPDTVQIIGGFDGWEGTDMTLLETGWHFVAFEAKANQFFKIRGAGSWDHELELYDAENDEWHKIADGELTFGQLWVDDTYKGDPCKWIELDFSAGRWSGYEEGIENVVLTEKAQKVMVDGVLYIVRDNKMYNVQGAQVR